MSDLTIKQRVTRIKEWDALGSSNIIERELLDAEQEAWERGWDQACLMRDEFSKRIEPMYFLMGIALGFANGILWFLR